MAKDKKYKVKDKIGTVKYGTGKHHPDCKFMWCKGCALPKKGETTRSKSSELHSEEYS